MRAIFAMVVSVAACGRFDFNARVTGDAGAADGDGTSTAPAFQYPRTDLFAVVGASVVSLVPTVSDPATRFSIAPALPPGLALDDTTGAITGTPTGSAEGTYTVTGTLGTATATATLAVTALPGYIVNSTADTDDFSGGLDAICADGTGNCTLRAAIQTTNNRTSKQLVLLDTQSYALGLAIDAIANDVVIAGQGAGATRIHAATVHGNWPAFTIGTVHTLSLRDVAIEDFGGSDGGALAVTAGTLDVDRCSFTNNASPTSGGVLFINGGAQATLSHCTFTSNASLGGNGGGWGGVIDGEGPATAIVVTRSYATKNTTAWGSFSHITTGTTLRLENSTLYDNTATTAGTLATPGGVYTLVNDTIVSNHNTATDSAGIYLYSSPCHYTVANTIVAFNNNPNGEADCNRRDLTTSLTSAGGNLFGDAGGNCAQYFTQPGDVLSTNPGVATGAPTDNGGATPTLLLVTGSRALGDGTASQCPAVDQRDHTRPMGAACDSGAVQMP